MGVLVLLVGASGVRMKGAATAHSVVVLACRGLIVNIHTPFRKWNIVKFLLIIEFSLNILLQERGN